MMFVKELVNDGDWEFVLHSASIEDPIVDAESLGAIMLLDQQVGHAEGRSALLDDALVDHGVALGL